MSTEVPVLPTVVPVSAVVLLLLVAHLRRRGLLTLPRAAVALALCVYAGGVVANTVFPVYLDAPENPAPWTAFVNTTLLRGYELSDAVMNVGVFVPVGILVALVVPRPSWARVLTVATLVSLAIEVTQCVTANLFGGGHVADVNDLLFDVVGAALGYAVLAALSRVPLSAGVVRRFRWVSA